MATLGLRPGVTDNSGRMAREALALVGLSAHVASGQIFFIFDEEMSREDVAQLAREEWGNELIHTITVESWEEFTSSNRFVHPPFPLVNIEEGEGGGEVELISLEVGEDQLMALSQKHHWALTLEEMKAIRDDYRSQNRETLPTDVELEIIAQTWSEHCKHKIFAGDVTFEGKKIHGLFKTFIQGATEHIMKERQLPWAISLFKDNAGIVRFDAKVDWAIKVETHNTPSALDPYGGALTGILGVNRDILGCGLGARPIGNTNVFCLAPPSWPETESGKRPTREQMPAGIPLPRPFLEGVHRGVEDGGNKSGTPTVNGAMFFDQDYIGRPLVFCGTIGVLPQTLPDTRPSDSKKPSRGDRIVMVGGGLGPTASTGQRGVLWNSVNRPRRQSFKSAIPWPKSGCRTFF